VAQKFEFRLLITGPESTEVYAIPLGKTTIGREPGREVALPHPLVSRLHAEIDCSESECQITDKGSANGTIVNDEPLAPETPLTLHHQAKILIGPFEIFYEQTPVEGAQVEEPPAGEAKKIESLPPQPSSEPEPEPKVKAGAKAKAKPEAKAKEGESADEKAAKPAGKGKKAAAAQKEESPPPLPPPPEKPLDQPPLEPEPASPFPPGLSDRSRSLINYLPGIYQTEFMDHFLALFESILVPIEWNVDHFDLFLDPGTSPTGFLPWLANWFEVYFDDTWSESQRRHFLKEAHQIYSRRGTRWSLSRILEIYTGCIPEIVDTGDGLEPHTFRVTIPVKENGIQRELVERMINANKPAYTTYTLKFIG